MSSTIVRRDYKWGDKDWRSQAFETFQEKKRVRTVYTVADGQVVRVTETTYEFCNPEAGVPADSTVGPPYLYADGTYREFIAYTFSPSTVKVTSYDTFSEDAYEVTADVFDPLEPGKFQRTRFHVSGKNPLAPTVASGTSRLVRRGITSQIVISPCDFADNKQKVDLPWAENIEDMDRAGLRIARRANSVSRTVTIAANPLIKRGDTVRLIDAARSLDVLGIVTALTIRAEIGSDMDVVIESWPSP